MYEKISKSLLEKALKAQTKEEALEILREGGVELTEDDLKEIVGGTNCPQICWAQTSLGSCSTYTNFCKGDFFGPCPSDRCGKVYQ